MSVRGDNPIVFADIDGVMNTSREYSAWGDACKVAYVLSGQATDGHDRAHMLFGPEHVRALNAITDQTDARIVLSSTWRFIYSGRGATRRLADLRGVFNLVGIRAPLIAATPLDVENRGEAIVAWLRANRESGARFTVLDDEPATNFPSSIRKHVLEINGAYGLNEQHVERAVSILKGRK